MSYRTFNKKPVYIISFVTALSLIGDSMLYVVLPVLWKQVGLKSLWEVGLVLSINRFIRIPLTPLIGKFYNNNSIRKGLLIAIILTIYTTTMYGYCNNLMMWCMMRCVWGIAWSFLRIAAYLKINEALYNRGHLMGIYNGVFRLGSLLGMLLGALLTEFIGLGNTTTLFGAATILSIPFIMQIRTINITKSSQLSTKKELTMQNLVRNKALVLLYITTISIALVFDGMLTATLSFIVDISISKSKLVMGVSASITAGIIQSLRWGWGPWLSPLVGRISDSFSRKKMTFYFLISSSLLFFVLLFDKNSLITISVLICIMLAATALTTLIDAVASNVSTSASRVSIMTYHALAWDIGAALGPIIGYIFINIVGIDLMYWFCILLLIILAVVWRKHGGNLSK